MLTIKARTKDKKRVASQSSISSSKAKVRNLSSQDFEKNTRLNNLLEMIKELELAYNLSSLNPKEKNYLQNKIQNIFSDQYIL